MWHAQMVAHQKFGGGAVCWAPPLAFFAISVPAVVGVVVVVVIVVSIDTSCCVVVVVSEKGKCDVSQMINQDVHMCASGHVM
jgi:hypothetical protein